MKVARSEWECMLRNGVTKGTANTTSASISKTSKMTRMTVVHLIGQILLAQGHERIRAVGHGQRDPLFHALAAPNPETGFLAGAPRHIRCDHDLRDARAHNPEERSERFLLLPSLDHILLLRPRHEHGNDRYSGDRRHTSAVLCVVLLLDPS